MDVLASKDQPNPEQSEAVPSFRRFKVTAAMELAVTADITVEAANHSLAGPRAEKILRGRAFTERLHKILAHHIIKIPVGPNSEVEVCVESVLLDWPPEATWWKMVDLHLEAQEQLTSRV